MIPGYDQIDLALLDAAQHAYGPCTVDSDLAHALVVESVPGWLLIAFQGTDPKRLADLITDVGAVILDVPGVGKVDAAFWRSMCSVSWALTPRVLKAKQAGLKVGAGGHSKGGQEAQGFTVQCEVLGMPLDRLTVFEPACGLGAAAQAMIAHVPGIATRNGPDQIPYMPEWFTNRPLTQMGNPGSEIDKLPDRWIPYHLLATVRPAFMSAIAPDVPLA